VSTIVDCAEADGQERGIAEAVTALRAGKLIVLPTDTVYGIAADAFDHDAVAALLAAKGRFRDSPPPVLIGALATLDGVARDVSAAGRALVDAFWPGPLTLVCVEQPSLTWDLGDAAGTVAVRMPDHPLALDLLRRTGPLAVSSANRTGRPPALTVADAGYQLGESVELYLDSGPCVSSRPSSIVDVSGELPRLLRAGALSLDQLRAVVPEIEAHPAT
jgi:L-threonylcarbamoyladenylate synthase